MEAAAPNLIIIILSGLCLGVGSVFAMIGGVGMLRLPDFYSRMHGAGITDTMGAGFILLGLIIYAGLSLVSVKLLLIAVFIFFTSPTATHAVAKAALSGHVKPLTMSEEKD